ncbi:hypothetical protein [Runella salmonicolor]|uniref:EpsG family protein n=1 Tax=Runella salmonicolor TaxID=2950278 RepID=A0ABT1FTC0_9BACT|nr:hypothetical protein [Runella salmonicolor]MCP1385013.1 hypothetical protein [Runella salmonicolor]
MKQPQQSLTTPFRWLDSKLQPFFDNKFWQIRLLFLALIVSTGTLLTFNFILVDKGLRSLYLEMRQPGSIGGLFWDDIIKQGADPFTPKDYEAGSHEANQTFRLTVPLIAQALHLNVAGLYLLHVLVGLVFLWFMTRAVYDIVKDKILTFYFMTGFTAIYAGANFYINFLGHCDAFPFCFMVLAFYFRNPLSVLLFTQLAFWCDERAIINSSYLGLWYVLPLIKQVIGKRKLSLKEIPLPVVALVMSAGVYLVIRQWLATTYGLKVGHDNDLSQQTSWWSLSILGDKFTRGLEGFWLIVFAGMAVLVMLKDWWALVLLGGCILITGVIGVMVADGTRSLSFGFYMFFFLLTILREHVPINQLKYLLIVSTLVSLMLPMSFP